MTSTALDKAHAAMQAAPEDAQARLKFFERFADNELFLLLETEAEGDQITPRVFPLEDGPVVLVFDREARLAAFAEGPAPYVGLSGRVLAGMLAEQGMGVGLNLEVAPSAMLLPPDAMAWLADMVASRPTEASGAWLAAVTYEGGARGHLLAFIDAIPGSESALAAAVGEALVFSGLEAGALDVSFFIDGTPVAERLARVGLRFDLPELTAPAQPSAPGTDPDRPPLLR